MDSDKSVSQYSHHLSHYILYTQDAIDLFLGNYVVDQWHELTSPSPLQLKRSWLARMVSLHKQIFLFTDFNFFRFHLYC